MKIFFISSKILFYSFISGVLLIFLNISGYSQKNFPFIKQVSEEKKAEILNNRAYQILDNNTDSAAVYAKEALHWAQKFNQNDEIGRSQFIIGYSKELNGDLLASLENYLKSLNAYYKINDHSGIASLASYVGTIYKMLGERDLAVQYFEMSLNNYIKAKDAEGVAFAYNNLGTIYMQMKLYQKAEQNFNKSLIFFNNNRDSTSAASIYINLGIIANEQNQLTVAKNLFLKAADIARLINNSDILATAYSNLAGVFDKQGLKKNAISFYRLSLDIGGNEFSIQRNANNNLNLAEIYSQLGQNEEAEKSFQLAISIAGKSKMRPLLCEAYRQYADFLAKNRRFEESTKYLQLFALQNDTLYDNEVLSKVSLSNIRIETIQQEHEKRILQKQNQIAELKLKSNRLLAIIFGALLIIIILILLLTIRKLKTIRNRKNILAQTLQQTEQKNLELQRMRDLLGKNISEKSLQLDNEWKLRIQNEKSASKLLQRFKKDILQREKAFLLLKEELNDSINNIIKKISQSESYINSDSEKAIQYLKTSKSQLESLASTFADLHHAMNADGENAESHLKVATFRRIIADRNETSGLLYLHPSLENAEFNNNEVVAKLIFKKLGEFFQSGFGKIAQIRLVPMEGNASLEVSAFVRNDVFDKLQNIVSPNSRALQRDDLLNSDFDFLSLIMLESMSYLFRIPLKIFLSNPNEPIVFQWIFPLVQKNISDEINNPRFHFLVLESDEKITSILLNKQLSSFGKVKILSDINSLDDDFPFQDYQYFFADFTFNEKPDILEKIALMLDKAPHLKSAAVIAYASPNEEDKLRQIGFDFILEKPIILQKIKNIINA